MSTGMMVSRGLFQFDIPVFSFTSPFCNSTVTIASPPSAAEAPPTEDGFTTLFTMDEHAFNSRNGWSGKAAAEAKAAWKRMPTRRRRSPHHHSCPSVQTTTKKQPIMVNISQQVCKQDNTMIKCRQLDQDGDNDDDDQWPNRNIKGTKSQVVAGQSVVLSIRPASTYQFD